MLIRCSGVHWRNVLYDSDWNRLHKSFKEGCRAVERHFPTNGCRLTVGMVGKWAGDVVTARWSPIVSEDADDKRVWGMPVATLSLPGCTRWKRL